MSDFLSIMAAPTAACLLLVGIFAHLGSQIVRRGVLFVDLALAQIAALGVTLALVLGYPAGSVQALVLSLAATALGALIFTLTRFRHPLVPQEAIIGITYVVSAAAIVLLVDRVPHGAEHIKYLLVGDILWVTPSALARIAAAVACVGAFHYLFAPSFAFAAEAAADADSPSLRMWDFLFYFSVALVVTASVQVAGVLLVFTFLVLPAVVGIILTESPRRQLATAWITGGGASVAGSMLSYRLDMPTGATIICLAGLILVAVAAAKPARRPKGSG